MKILIIGNRDLATNSFSTVWLKALPTALQKHGCTIGWFPRAPHGQHETWLVELLKVAQNYDHIIAPGVRYFSTLPYEIVLALQKGFSGALTQICDGAFYGKTPVDINFTIKDVADKNETARMAVKFSRAWNVAIGWGADEKLFYPEQTTHDTLNIFVDHANFDCKADYSLSIFMNIAQGRNTFLAQGYSRVRVRTLTDEGIVDINLDEIAVRPFTRRHISCERFAAELRRCDIFIVTHHESVGLTALEAAKCGAYILCPKGTIPEDRLMRIHHQTITFPINWQRVLNKPDKAACALRVKNESWDNIASKIIGGLKEWKSANKRKAAIV